VCFHVAPHVDLRRGGPGSDRPGVRVLEHGDDEFTLDDRSASGIDGLDEVLGGGFLPRRSYLIRGGPGTGKTTLGLHFLAAGAARGERALFLGQGQALETVRSDAHSLGIDLATVEFLDLSPGPELFGEGQAYDVFSPADVERGAFTDRIVARIDELKPARVLLDGLTQVRNLATDVVDFRRQAASFLRFLLNQGATVLVASDSMTPEGDQDLQFMVDGVIHLGYDPGEGRSLTVTKLRGSRFSAHRHTAKIGDRGLAVFPRLVPDDYRREYSAEAISSGVPRLDQLLHGGLERGTVTLLSGPSGVGKTTLGLQFMKEAAGRGERSVVYTFEEAAATLLYRSAAVAIPVAAMVEQGTLVVEQVEPLRYTPDEFALSVRQEVERRDARIVMLDSLSGYQLSIRGDDLVRHVHALCKYLKNMGVTVLVILEVERITGEFRISDLGISYLADNVVFLRYLEIDGELRRVVGVLKKRMSDFEKSMRELTITRYGLMVGEPLRGLRGILAGILERVAEPPTTPAEPG
jgi:circadian clock protein KaiC